MARTKQWDEVKSSEVEKPKPRRNNGTNYGSLPSGAKLGESFSGDLKVTAIYFRSNDFLAGRGDGPKGSSFSFAIKKKIDKSDIKEGTLMSVKGTWVSYKQTIQVDISSFEIRSQDEKQGFVETVLRFIDKQQRTSELTSLLEHLWDDFGERVIEVVSSRNEELRSKGYTFTRDMCRIRSAIISKINKDVKVKSIADLKLLGVRGPIADKMYDDFGNDCVSLMRESPYKAAIEFGMKNFSKIDEIGKKIGISPLNIDRLKLAIVSTMEDIKDSGHCSIKADDLIKEASLKLGVDVDDDIVLDALEACISDILVILDEDDVVYPYDLHEAECVVARNIVIRHMVAVDEDEDQISITDAMNEASEELNITFTDEQEEAVKKAWNSPISIITGGPGTGKTTVCKAIVTSLKKANHNIALCCPTGRGAKRLAETVGMEAKTIHRMIGYAPNTESWDHGLLNQLPHTAIIVDESSMVDIELMRILIDATPGMSRLILVGDYDQLPSVGPGRLLRDLIEIDLIPVTRLSHIFRQQEGSDIIGVSHEIRQGIIPEIVPLSSESLGEGMCSFYKCNDANKLSFKVMDIVEGLSSVYGIDPMEVQILTPMKRGPIGTEVLNRIIQERFNPLVGSSECRIDDVSFRCGDKVLQIRNDYDRNIFNGDAGRIETATSSGVKVVFDDGSESYYDRFDIPTFLIHNYAMTIHRSQGSEFPVGVVLMHDSHQRMLQRNLLYTGISRFRRAVIICGTESAIEMAVKNDIEERRNTGLKARMTDVLSVLNETF